jgi:hypothetical protein
MRGVVVQCMKCWNGNLHSLITVHTSLESNQTFSRALRVHSYGSCRLGSHSRERQ